MLCINIFLNKYFVNFHRYAYIKRQLCEFIYFIQIIIMSFTRNVFFFFVNLIDLVKIHFIIVSEKYKTCKRKHVNESQIWLKINIKIRKQLQLLHLLLCCICMLIIACNLFDIKPNISHKHFPFILEIIRTILSSTQPTILRTLP